MELHTINQNEAGIRLGMADYYNGYKMSIPNTSMKIAGESIEDLHISDRIPHILRGTYLTVSNADVTRPCEIIGLQGGSATGTNEIKVDILPIQIADTTRDGLSITRDDRDITINGKCEPTGTIKTGTTVTHSNATDWARLNSFTNSNVSSTVEGTSFTLTDASSTKQASITELKGNTTQEGTPTPSSPVEVQTVSGDNNVVVVGKNYIGKEGITFPFTQNGVTVTREDDGSFTFNGTLTASYNFNLSPYSNNETYISLLPLNNQTVTLSYSSTGTGKIRNYGIKRSNGNDIFVSGATSRTATLSISNSDITFCIRLATGDVTDNKFENFNVKPQLEKGTTATTYEQYKGNTYRVDLGGKNLLNYDGTYYRRHNEYTSITTSGNDITITHTYANTNGFLWWNVPVEVGKTYTISYSNMVETTTNSNNALCYSQSDSAITSYTNLSSAGITAINKTNKYVTITASKSNLAIILRTGTSNGYTISNVQLEKRKRSNIIQSIRCKPNRTM